MVSIKRIVYNDIAYCIEDYIGIDYIISGDETDLGIGISGLSQSDEYESPECDNYILSFDCIIAEQIKEPFFPVRYNHSTKTISSIDNLYSTKIDANYGKQKNMNAFIKFFDISKIDETTYVMKVKLEFEDPNDKNSLNFMTNITNLLNSLSDEQKNFLKELPQERKGYMSEDEQKIFIKTIKDGSLTEEQKEFIDKTANYK